MKASCLSLAFLVLPSVAASDACLIDTTPDGPFVTVEAKVAEAGFEGGSFAFTTVVTGPSGQSRSMQGGTVPSASQAYPVTLATMRTIVMDGAVLQVELTLMGDAGRSECSLRVTPSSPE